MSEDTETVDETINRLQAENERLRARVAELEGPEFTLVNRDLLREIERLRAQVREQYEDRPHHQTWVGILEAKIEQLQAQAREKE
jgi:predicted RNase H-like nuclease (RuvC/YqgF family)